MGGEGECFGNAGLSQLGGNSADSIERYHSKQGVKRK